MKRILPILALLILGAAAALADETVEVYRRIYAEAEGLSQKYSAALSLVQLKDRSIAPVLGDALKELVLTQSNYISPSEKELYARVVGVVASALGEFKHVDSAPFLWSVVQQVPEPLAKAEALVALGKMRALDYAERIALLLRDLNLKPTEVRDFGEKVAYGAILSLEKLRDPRGFSPVFFAGDAWYSLRVRQQAERSLSAIAEDPTDSIMQILSVESPERRIRALAAEIASKATTDRKIAVASYALALGHDKAPIDRAEARLFADLRKGALRALAGFRAKADAAVPGCVASYEKGYDDEERLLGLSALGANGTDPSATALRDIILKLNSEQRAGLADEVRNRMARAAIENAALTKNQLLRVALVSVSTNDKWSGGIILAARNALKEMP